MLAKDFEGATLLFKPELKKSRRRGNDKGNAVESEAPSSYGRLSSTEKLCLERTSLVQCGIVGYHNYSDV